jgi:enoyl-CoA hydratase
MSATNSGTVRLELEDGIAQVVFDRAEARNALTWAMYEQLAAICQELRADASVRCAMFRGAGGEAFVAGTDIEQFRSFATGEDGLAYEQRIDEGIALLESLPMPTLAVVEGWAVGAGLAIATACDVRIAREGSRFGVPIARTLGNCLSMANVARLVAAFGKSRVQRMLIAAEMIDAAEAQACGYLAQVVKRQDVDEAAWLHARQLAALAPVTQAVSKEALRRLVLRDLPDAQDLIRRAYASDDFREGVNAFGEKRTPRWTGR